MTNLDTIVAVYSENPGPDIDWPAQEAAEADWAAIEAAPKRVRSISPMRRWSRTATAKRWYSTASPITGGGREPSSGRSWVSCSRPRSSAPPSSVRAAVRWSPAATSP